MRKLISRDTIFALSTIFGKSAVSIIRISGCDALQSLRALGINKEIKPRYAYFLPIKIENEIIDHCLVLYFKAPNSFTGEDIVELQLHGSKAIIKSVLDFLSKINNYRMAEHGEFTRRAFLNGKVNLIQAEGLLSVIHADTAMQLKQANKEYSGKSTEIFQNIRDEFLTIFANCEALLDFPEDDFDGNDVKDNIFHQLEKIRDTISLYLNDNRIGEKIKEGFKVAIVGRPNVGKSSLMNYLAKRPIAIVSDIPGTTRDLIRITLDISGYAVELIDTAGIRETNDAIESIGVNLAKDTLNESDLILILVTRDDVDSYSDFIENFDIEKHILIINKVDDELNSCYVDINDRQYLQISVKNHCNLSEIIKIIESKIENIASTNSSIITTQRQRFILEKTYTELNIILNNEYQFIDIMTEDIRSLIEHMNELIGDVTNDDVLDKLFYNFCIGK